SERRARPGARGRGGRDGARLLVGCAERPLLRGERRGARRAARVDRRGGGSRDPDDADRRRRPCVARTRAGRRADPPHGRAAPRRREGGRGGRGRARDREPRRPDRRPARRAARRGGRAGPGRLLRQRERAARRRRHARGGRPARAACADAAPEGRGAGHAGDGSRRGPALGALRHGRRPDRRPPRRPRGRGVRRARLRRGRPARAGRRRARARRGLRRLAAAQGRMNHVVLALAAAVVLAASARTTKLLAVSFPHRQLIGPLLLLNVLLVTPLGFFSDWRVSWAIVVIQLASVVTLVGGSFCMFELFRRGSAAAVSVGQAMAPVPALVFSFALLSAPISAWQVAGVLVVTSAVLLALGPVFGQLSRRHAIAIVVLGAGL